MLENPQVGQFVTYKDHGKTEKGRIKEVPENSPGFVRVVFHCNNKWNSYMDYTSALTPIEYLEDGWNEDENLQVTRT